MPEDVGGVDVLPREARSAGLGALEIRRLQAEDGNRRLRPLVADLTLDKAMLQEVPRATRLCFADFCRRRV